MHIILLAILAIPQVLAITLDANHRVVDDMSMYNDEGLRVIGTNYAWNHPTVAPLNIQYGHKAFYPEELYSFNNRRNEFIKVSGAVCHVNSIDRPKIISAIKDFEDDEDKLVIRNSNLTIVLRDRKDYQADPKTTAITYVRVYEVTGEKLNTDVSPEKCDCIFDVERGDFTTGIDPNVNNPLTHANNIVRHCPGNRLCFMTSLGTVDPYMPYGQALYLKRLMLTLVDYEAAMAKRGCKKSDDLTDLLDYIAPKENPPGVPNALWATRIRLTFKGWDIRC